MALGKLNKHSGHSFSHISTSKNSVSYVFLFVVLFCFFQVFLNISTACLTPEPKIVFGLKKVLKNRTEGGCVSFCYLDFSEFFMSIFRRLLPCLEHL